MPSRIPGYRATQGRGPACQTPPHRRPRSARTYPRDSSPLEPQNAQVLTDLQGGLGDPQTVGGRGLIADVHRLFSVAHGTLIKIGVVVLAYAILEGLEAVGLWLMCRWAERRWAEYLTFI